MTHTRKIFYSPRDHINCTKSRVLHLSIANGVRYPKQTENFNILMILNSDGKSDDPEITRRGPVPFAYGLLYSFLESEPEDSAVSRAHLKPVRKII